MDNETFTGVLEDPRTEGEREGDYHDDEIMPAQGRGVTWQHKAPSEWKTYPIRNQDGSGSCVAQTLAKLLGIENLRESNEFVELSAKDIYTRRKNKPAAGMWGIDALNIAKNHGATLEQLMPSQDQTEAQINEVDRKKYEEQIARVFRIKNYVLLPFDIDRIAGALDMNKGVMVWFRFWYDEWNGKPEVKHEGRPPLHHSVCAVDYTLGEDGKKYIIIEDSWGDDRGIEGRRMVSEDFIKARMTFAAYVIDLENEGDGTMPKEKPSYPHGVLELKEKSDAVIALQNCLKHDGTFPLAQQATGYYGAITAKAVYAFQVKHNVAPKDELDELKGKRVGSKTVRKLRALYPPK